MNENSFKLALSRRGFLKAAGAFASAAAFPALGQSGGKTWMFVGCYTARGQGISVYEVNLTTGALTFVRAVPAGNNPSFLAIDPHGRYLFNGNEIGNYEGRQSGSVTAFAIDASTGNLTEINRQPTEGRNPAHVSVDPTGRYVFAANYSGTTTMTNQLAVIPIGANGALQTPTHIVTHEGMRGPNMSRQEAPHAHQIIVDPTGRWTLANDLGLDQSYIYFIERSTGFLALNQYPITAPPGGGPRHSAFHPNGRFLYVLNELNSTLSAHSWDPERGAATLIRNLSTLPDWYKGINTTAQVVVSPDGKFVYASNRGHDSIAIFSINQATGDITYAGEQWTFGETPRNFNITPGGDFMYVAHQNTDNIVTFKIDKATGKLEFSGQLLTTGQPVCLVFLSPPAPGNIVRAGVTFHAISSPCFADSSGLGQTTLAWNAPGEVEIRIGAPDGPSMGRQASYGTQTTGRWVTDGMTFFLQEAGRSLIAENTLGTARVRVIS
jgi:6-phosphogluconolactonase